MTCHSGGTLEIAVEPILPAPALWIAGTTPIAGALATLGAAAGFRVTVVDAVADARGVPDRPSRAPRRRPPTARPGASPYIVVATQGQWDEEALAAALRRDAAYVGLVASPTRAAAVRGWLREENGLAEERLAALRAPAGMDLGAEMPEEVAISILAELVQVRRGRAAVRRVAGAGDAVGERRPPAATSDRPGRDRAPSTRSAA